MYVLINVNGIVSQEETREERVRTVYYTVVEIYNNSVSIDGSCLRNFDSIKYEDNPESCIFGCENPDKIRKIANGWQDAIAQDFTKALANFQKEQQTLGQIPFDGMVSYCLKKAVMAVDNSFCDFALYATAMKPNQSHFKTLIEEKEMSELQEHPEYFALIEVWPK